MKMKNTTSCAILSLILSLLFGTTVNAASSGLKLSCPESADDTKEIVCELSGNTDVNISSLNFNVSLEGLVISNISAEKESLQIKQNETQVEIASTEKLLGNFTLGKITLKPTSKGITSFPANIEGKIELKNVIYHASPADSSTALGSVSNIKLTINKSTELDTTLSSLKISGYELDFKPGTKNYTLEIDSNQKQLDITAVPTDGNSKIEITGNENLLNASIINIRVSNGSDSAIYKINIKKAVVPVENKTKENKISSDLLIYIVIGGAILLIIIVLVIFLILKKRKKNIPLPEPTSIVEPQSAPFTLDDTPSSEGIPAPNTSLVETPDLGTAPAPINIAGNAPVPQQIINPVVQRQASVSYQTINPATQVAQAQTIPEQPSPVQTQSQPVQGPVNVNGSVNMSPAMPQNVNDNSGISIKNMPFEKASSDNPMSFES